MNDNHINNDNPNLSSKESTPTPSAIPSSTNDLSSTGESTAPIIGPEYVADATERSDGNDLSDAGSLTTTEGMEGITIDQEFGDLEGGENGGMENNHDDTAVF